jgi:hypothetical protein
MHIALDHSPPYIFTVEYDTDDGVHDFNVELLCRSELVARGHRLDETAWPQWYAGTPIAPDAPPEEPVPTSPAPIPTPAPRARRLPATVVTWNCGGLMVKMHEVDNLIKFKHPDIIFLTETFLLQKQHNHLSRILAKGYTPLYSSLDAKGHGRPRGGVAVLVSSEWAHASAIKRWAGKSIPGYLDGVEVLTSDGLSHTLLAAYVPPGSDDTDLARRVRSTIQEASVRSGDRLVTAGDFNSVMPGGRRTPSPGDRAHAELIQLSASLASPPGDAFPRTLPGRQHTVHALTTAWSAKVLPPRSESRCSYQKSSQRPPCTDLSYPR